MSDVFTAYETGLTRLLERMDKEHPRYSEALTLQSRLLENIIQARRYGDTETRRAERAQIVDTLNLLALQALGIDFNGLCPGLIAPPSSWVQLRMCLHDVTKRETEILLSEMKQFPYVERLQLRQQFDDFLQSDKSLLIVVGESGTGKSTFFAHLASDYQGNGHIAFLMYTTGSYSSEAFRETTNIDRVIGHALSSLESEGPHAGGGLLSTVKDLFHSEHQRVIIVFDAINESFGETGRVSQPKDLLERISHFVKEIDDARIKVVVTTRPGIWDIIHEPIRPVKYRCFPSSDHYWIDLGNWEPSEASEAYDKYRSWHHVATVYGDLDLRWRGFIRNPLNLHVLCKASEGGPVVSSPRDLYHRYLSILVQEGILEKDAPPFIERELMRLMIPDNLAEPSTNAIDHADLDERQRQLLRSLVDAGVLIEFVGAYDSGTPRYLYRFRYERFFDHLGGYRVHSLLSSLDDSELVNSALSLVNSLDRYPFMWGALQEALALTLEEGRQSALSTLCLRGHVVLTEMFITFLKEIGLADRDIVCQFNEPIWENRWRVQGKAERYQVERLCVEIAARFFQENLLVKIAEESILPRSYIADQIYLLWRADAEEGRTEKNENRGLRIVDRTLSEIRWSRPRLSLSLLITSALVTAAIYLWEHEATGALLQRMWRPVFQRFRYLIPLIPAVGPLVVLLLARRREYESSANFQEIGAFFKLPEDQKAYVRRLVPFLHPEEHTLQEAKPVILEVCDHAVNPPVAFFVQKILEVHGVQGQLGQAVDLAREIFDRDLKRAHPTMCAICMHSVCWDLIRISEKVSDHSFNALRDMTVSFFREVPDFRFDGAAGSYHPLLFVRYAVARAKKTGRIEIDLADEFIQTMLDRDLIQPVRDYIYDFGALALRGQEELALEGAKYVVNVEDSVVQERLGQLLARVGARYPDLAKDFIQEHIPSHKQRAFETRMKAAKVQRVEGDILASVDITVVDALRDPTLWKLIVWGVDQMMKCQNLFQWMTIVARHAVELVLAEDTKENE